MLSAVIKERTRGETMGMESSGGDANLVQKLLATIISQATRSTRVGFSSYITKLEKSNQTKSNTRRSALLLQHQKMTMRCSSLEENFVNLVCNDCSRIVDWSAYFHGVLMKIISHPRKTAILVLSRLRVTKFQANFCYM